MIILQIPISEKLLEVFPSFLSLFAILVISGLLIRRTTVTLTEEKKGCLYEILQFSIIGFAIFLLLKFTLIYGIDSYKIFFKGKANDWYFALSFWSMGLIIIVITGSITIPLKRVNKELARNYYEKVFGTVAFFVVIPIIFTLYGFIFDNFITNKIIQTVLILLGMGGLGALLERIQKVLKNKLFREDVLLNQLEGLSYQYTKSDYEKAVKILTELIEIDPSPKHYEERAIKYELLSETELAIEDITNAISLSTEYTNPYLFEKRAQLKKEVGDIEGSEEDKRQFEQLRFKR
jgi:tetratricopeptide (TPR) repeat protein